jgi:hypothetical protein
MGFYLIKKKRLNDIRGFKKVDPTSTLPIFFRNHSAENHLKFSATQNFHKTKND